MPLYKRKILSQKDTNTVKSSSNIEQKKKRVFKTPLIQNEIQLNHFDNVNDIFKQLDQQTEKLSANKQSQKLALPQFQVNFEQIESHKEIFANENVQRIIKRKNINIKKPEISTKEDYNNISEENVRTKGKKDKIISNIFGDAKEKISDSKKRKAIKRVKGVHENDKNNNEKIGAQIKKKTTIKKNLKKKELNSDLNESVISLWRQSDTPPSLEPPEHLSYLERLLWLQDKRNVGLYVQCDKCDKFRYLKDTADPLELPDLWYCHMNPDKNYNKCSYPEYKIPMWEEEDLIHNLYNAGSVVWARLDGYPWWPAMVDDDPDTEMYYWLNEYSDVPTYYHVVFFDSEEASRAWLKPAAIMKFKDNINNPIFEVPKRLKKYKIRIEAAQEQAKNALKLNVADRLKNYSFLARWSKPINSPRDLIDEKRNKKSKVAKKSKVRKTERKSKTNWKENKFNLDNFIKECENGGIISPELFEENEDALEEIDLNLFNTDEL